jgi:hypothetical protein
VARRGLVQRAVAWCGAVRQVYYAKNSAFSAPWRGAVRFGAVRRGAVRRGAARCSAAQCGAARFSAARHGSAWRGAVQRTRSSPEFERKLPGLDQGTARLIRKNRRNAGGGGVVLVPVLLVLSPIYFGPRDSLAVVSSSVVASNSYINIYYINVYYSSTITTDPIHLFQAATNIYGSDSPNSRVSRPGLTSIYLSSFAQVESFHEPILSLSSQLPQLLTSTFENRALLSGSKNQLLSEIELTSKVELGKIPSPPSN